MEQRATAVNKEPCRRPAGAYQRSILDMNSKKRARGIEPGAMPVVGITTVTLTKLRVSGKPCQTLCAGISLLRCARALVTGGDDDA
jgi:hypothetical protein